MAQKFIPGGTARSIVSGRVGIRVIERIVLTGLEEDYEEGDVFGEGVCLCVFSRIRQVSDEFYGWRGGYEWQGTNNGYRTDKCCDDAVICGAQRMAWLLQGLWARASWQLTSDQPWKVCLPNIQSFRLLLGSGAQYTILP
jgi:hypothetical protein